MEKFLTEMATQEHTWENWKQWYDAFRPKTALEPHDVRLIAMDEEHMILSMQMGEHAMQPYGLLHGGMSMMLAETAASVHSCWGVDLRKRVPVGIEINGSHLRSASEGTIITAAHIIRKSQTLAHHNVEVRQKEGDRLLSVVRVTNLYKKLKRDS